MITCCDNLFCHLVTSRSLIYKYRCYAVCAVSDSMVADVENAST
jgi:hypothetical protein